MRLIKFTLLIAYLAIFHIASAQNAACGTPLNLQSVVTDSNIVLSWDSVPGAKGYKIKAGKKGFPSFIHLKSYTNSYIIPKVPKCLQFVYNVQAFCQSGPGTPSLPDTVTTGGCINCHVPANLTTSNITANSALISWEKVDDALFYVLEGRVVGYPKYFKVFVKDTSFAANFLAPGYTFEWRLYVVCSKSSIAGPTAWQSFTTASMKSDDLTSYVSGVYPNPAQNSAQLNVLSFEDKIIEIRLLDISGKVIQQFDRKVNSGINSIDLDLRDLQAGMYFIQYDGLTERVLINK